MHPPCGAELAPSEHNIGFCLCQIMLLVKNGPQKKSLKIVCRNFLPTERARHNGISIKIAKKKCILDIILIF